MNKIQLIGRLTKDLELRYTNSGVAVANGTIAVSRRKKDETDFINILVWDKIAENTTKYCGKGSQIAISGRLQVSSYDNNDGKRVYKTEVVCEEVEFLGSKKDSVAEDKKDFGVPIDDFTPVQEDDDMDSDLPF